MSRRAGGALRKPGKQVEHIVVTLGQAAAAGQRYRAEAQIVPHGERREDLPAFRHQRHPGSDESVAGRAAEVVAREP